MADLEIRPTMRFIAAGYALAGVLFLAALAWWIAQRDAASEAVLLGSAALLLWPAARHLQRQRTRCSLQNGQLRFESGLFTTTVKSIPVANIQDVTVRRTLNQRIWGVGDLLIESAGKSSALEIVNVDDPQKCAERILASIPPR